MGRMRVDLFCEDRGHEQFIPPLIKRLRVEIGLTFHLNTISSRGGKGRALAELKGYQKALTTALGQEMPDLLVLAVDTNCSNWRSVREEILGIVDSSVFPNVVVGCPDPHVERWCIADPEGFRTAVEAESPPDPDKCEKDVYKRLLRDTIKSAGHPILTDEMEFAPEIVQAMDLYQAGKNQPSLRHFVDDLRSALQRLRSVPGTRAQ